MISMSRNYGHEKGMPLNIEIYLIQAAFSANVSLVESKWN